MPWTSQYANIPRAAATPITPSTHHPNPAKATLHDTQPTPLPHWPKPANPSSERKKVSTPPSPKQPAKSRALPAAPSDSPARDPCQCDDPQRRASVHLAVSAAGPTDASACDGTGVRRARHWAGGGREDCISGRDLCFLALWGLRGRGAGQANGVLWVVRGQGWGPAGA